jgi:acetyl-CoA carboxylase biotin carboxyl carrier protein
MSNDKHASDVEFIEALARLLRDNDLTEVEVKREYGEDDALNVRVARQVTSAVAAVAAPPVLAAAPVAPAPAAPSPSGDPALDPDAVTSPMVGTAYLQPEPGAEAFVSVGSEVKEGQTILIIEAMKTMNQIPAPCSGKVTRILIEDGAPVEFGTPLLVIE